MAIAIETDELFTDTNLPTLKIDDILTDGNGSLVLFDASLNSDNSFIGSNSGFIQNLAWDQARALIPSATESTLRGVTSKVFNSGEGIVELTAKKGIHTIVSQSVAVAQHGFIINLPDTIKTYFLTHLTNSFFVSIWGRTTRATLDTTDQFVIHGIVKPTPGNGRFVYTKPEGYVPTPPYQGNRLNGNDRTVGNYHRNYAQNIWSAGTTPNPSTIADFMAFFQYGSRDMFFNFNTNKSASGIFYKMYIEDLTVSGRSYATVDALDKTLYDSAFGTGGRFSGDTFTAPSTIV